LVFFSVLGCVCGIFLNGFLDVHLVRIAHDTAQTVIYSKICAPRCANQYRETDLPTIQSIKPRFAGLYAKTQVAGNPSPAINFRDKAPHWPAWTPPDGAGHRLHPSHFASAPAAVRTARCACRQAFACTGAVCCYSARSTGSGVQGGKRVKQTEPKRSRTACCQRTGTHAHMRILERPLHV